MIKPALFRQRFKAGIKLPFPVSPRLKVAQLGPPLSFETVQPFCPGHWAELSAYGPQVVIGSAAELRQLARRLQIGAVDLRSLEHAIVVVTPYRTPPASDVLRVTLWQSFGVPIFEVYLSPDNALAAWECAAHEGWHIAPGYQFEVLNGELLLASPGNFGIRTGLAGVLETAACPCGDGTHRLLEVAQLETITAPISLAVSA